MLANKDKGGENRPYNIQYEKELIERAQKELPYNADAYSELVKEYQGRIYWMCRRIVCDDSEAHDAAQEVLIRVFHHLPKFKAESSFKTWLYSIARNVSLTHIKKSNRLREAESMSDRTEWVEHSYEPHNQTEAAMDMDRMFSKLNVVERQIISLRFVADLNLNEIADFLGIGLSSAKMRLYRAISRLEKMMAAHS